MKRLGLLTTSFLLTVSLAIYSRNLPITLTSLGNHAMTLVNHSSNSVQNGFRRSLNQVFDKTKSNSFSPMTKDSDE